MIILSLYKNIKLYFHFPIGIVFILAIMATIAMNRLKSSAMMAASRMATLSCSFQSEWRCRAAAGIDKTACLTSIFYFV